MPRPSGLIDAYVAAHLYYEVHLTQEEIAHRMEVSRPTVSKLLRRAHEEKIVRVAVRNPGERDLGLQGALSDVLGLKAAAVVPGAPKSVHARGVLLAQGTIALLKDCLPTLPRFRYMGLGWGRAILALVEALEQTETLLGGPAEVVPLVGGSGQSIDVFQGNELVRRAADAFGANPRLLHAPALVANKELRGALLSEPSIGAVVGAWSNLDVAVVGIGKRLTVDYQHAYIAEYLQDEVLVSTAVGDVCSRYFDAAGNALGEEHDAGLIAISREDLGRIPLAVGVASGPEKVAAMIGAARGGLINAIVTDEGTARSCLEIAEAA